MKITDNQMIITKIKARIEMVQYLSVGAVEEGSGLGKGR
jgi:hypothetical protein